MSEPEYVPLDPAVLEQLKKIFSHAEAKIKQRDGDYQKWDKLFPKALASIAKDARHPGNAQLKAYFKRKENLVLKDEDHAVDSNSTFRRVMWSPKEDKPGYREMQAWNRNMQAFELVVFMCRYYGFVPEFEGDAFREVEKTIRMDGNRSLVKVLLPHFVKVTTQREKPIPAAPPENGLFFVGYYFRKDAQIGKVVLEIRNTAAYMTVYYRSRNILKVPLKGDVYRSPFDAENAFAGASVKERIFIHLQDDPGRRAGLNIVHTALCLYVEDDLLDVTSLTGTYASFSRTPGSPLPNAGIMLLDRKDSGGAAVSDAESEHVPETMYRLLYGKRFNIERKNALNPLKASKIPRAIPAEYVGKYQGYQFRSTEDDPRFEYFSLEINSNGTGRLIVPPASSAKSEISYLVYFNYVQPGYFVGSLEYELDGDSKERAGRDDSPFYFFLTPVAQTLRGVYGGIEKHHSTHPVAGRVYLKKLLVSGPAPAVTISPLPVFTSLNQFNEQVEVLFRQDPHVKSFLTGEAQTTFTDWIGRDIHHYLEQHEGSNGKPGNPIPNFLIGDFVCFSPFKEEKGGKHLIGKYPLQIGADGQVKLRSAKCTYQGVAHWGNNLLDIRLENKEYLSYEVVVMVFSIGIVAKTTFNHVCGVSLDRNGTRIEARAEILKRSTTRYENTRYEEIELNGRAADALADFDARYPGVVSFLRGDLYRYMEVPDEIDPALTIRARPHRRVHFYAACYIGNRLTKMPRSEDNRQLLQEIGECKNLLSQAYLHGFAQPRQPGSAPGDNEEDLDVEKQLKKWEEDQKECEEDQKLLAAESRNGALSHPRLQDYVHTLWPALKPPIPGEGSR